MHFKGIHHIALATRSMDSTIRFWRDLIGLTLVIGLGGAGHRQYFFNISGDCFLAFFEWPDVEPVPEKDHGYPASGPLAFDHLALSVQTEQGLWELKDSLDAAGFWVSEIIDHGFIHSLYSFDPNGIAVEFSWAVPQVDVVGHPQLLDSSPSVISREGPDPRPENWPTAIATPDCERRVYPGEGRELVEHRRRNWWAQREGGAPIKR